MQGAEDVLRRIHADPHVEPNVTTYNLVINAYANKGHWKVSVPGRICTCCILEHASLWGRRVL